jgi:serine/threonine-protein kinase
MGGSDSRDKDSITEVAEQSFVRARPLEIERGSVLASRYQVEEIIGKGGSGVVLRVFDRTAQNVVALKVLKTELAFDAKWDKRFSRELRLGRPIQHPNVCRIFDINEAEGHRFLTMELASGGSLRDELKRRRATERPLDERLADARMAVAGLSALHAAGVVHRDFKPDNLLRMADGRLVISDFGLATDAANAPGATVLIGTPHYMAPEVLGGEPATSRSDVWALGVVLHEIMFGRRPERRSVSFDGSEKGPLMPRSTQERRMLALCERCLAEAPLDRPMDATVVAQMFESVRPGSAPRPKTKRTRALAYALALLAISGGAGALRAWHRRSRPIAAPSGPGILLPDPSGTPADWARTGKIITAVSEKVSCFSMLDAQTAQIVLGEPRRAEDVDVATGRRSPAHLLPETYALGCPQRSPSGTALLFGALTPAGAKEIRLSRARDGTDAMALTSGTEPLWFGDGEDFLYAVDVSHAAIFSLPTMSFTLLAAPQIDGQRPIMDKAVSRDGRSVGLLLYGTPAALAIYGGRAFASQAVYLADGVRRLQFGPSDNELLAVYESSSSSSTVAAIDLRNRTVANVGRYGGFRLFPAPVVGGNILLARRNSSDAWAFVGGHRQRLTDAGNVYAAARSNLGDLLLTKEDAAGSLNIWLQGRDGGTRKLTGGDKDVTPDFAPDGRRWAYADYSRKTIMLCAPGRDRCDVLVTDERLPTWPRFSPDGKDVAYLTQIGSTQLTIVSSADGARKISWDARSDCPPVWSSATTLWSIGLSAGHYAWVERDATTGKATGKRVAAPAESATDEVRCWPDELPPDSPLVGSVGTVGTETTLLLSVQ